MVPCKRQSSHVVVVVKDVLDEIDFMKSEKPRLALDRLTELRQKHPKSPR
jgi:hypothetical protein